MSDEAVDNIIRLAAAAGKAPLITEDSAALAFAQKYHGEFLFDHNIGSWFRWTNSHWQQEHTRLAYAWARNLVRDLTEGAATKTKTIGRKTSFVNGVEKFAITDRAFAVSAADWNVDPFLLATPTGTVELHTGELRPGNPGDRINQVAAVGPSRRADCPRWFRFLDEFDRR